MQKLYLAEFGPATDERALNDMLSTLSPEKKSRVERYRSEADRKAGIYSEALVRCLLSAGTGERYSRIRLDRSGTGKPFAPDFPQWQFSISHTTARPRSSPEGAVAVCVSDKPVGVDVERIAKMDEALPARIMTAREAAWLREDISDVNRRFFELWTKKEACVKRDGKGLAIDLRSFDVTGAVPYGTLSTVARGAYIISVCSAEGLLRDDVITMSETELIELWRRCAV